jgi:hypothetical protein
VVRSPTNSKQGPVLGFILSLLKTQLELEMIGAFWFSRTFSHSNVQLFSSLPLCPVRLFLTLATTGRLCVDRPV